jgi:intracellular sulfur oxidation DsrE/DsrF family protein
MNDAVQGYRIAVFVPLLLGALLRLSAPAYAEPPGVVYHLDDAKNGRFSLHLAEDHLSIDPDLRIAVVAYAAGVDFLLKGATDSQGRPYEPEVKSLIDKGVQFRVCAATLNFRDIPQDKVLDGVELVPSGTYEIIRWQREEGFVYLKP